MSWFKNLEHIVREQEPMGAWNWLRIGGPAEYFAEPTNEAELVEILKRTSAAEIPVRLLGGGSNILVRDEGVSGAVIHLSAPAFCDIRVEANHITSGGGSRLNHVIASAAREGLAGFEALVGIPGTIGGALRRNAIGHGAAIGQWTDSVTVLSRKGDKRVLHRDDLRFGYRESNLDNLVVLEAVFALEPGEMLKVTRQMQKLWIMKRASQPSVDVGHGQVFANPRGITAGELIEQAGLKGTHVGGAWVSEVDANFIEAREGASTSDVLALIAQIRSRVSEVMSVDLIPELEVW